MSASTQSVRLGGPRHRPVRERVAGGIAVVLLAEAAFVTFGRSEPSTGGITPAETTDVSVVDVTWTPKWAAAAARSSVPSGDVAIDTRWIPKQHLDAGRTSRTG